MPLWKHKAYRLTETDIRYAMENSRSNVDAAKFLRISFPTYKKYAKMYTDSETGKTLFETHKIKHGFGRRRYKGNDRLGNKKGLAEILDGKHPTYSGKRLKARLIKEGFREEKCEHCDFSERRLTDYTVPLILLWLDGDKTNHRDENLRLVCFNCYYVMYFNQQSTKADRLDFEGYRDDER